MGEYGSNRRLSGVIGLFGMIAPGMAFGQSAPAAPVQMKTRDELVVKLSA